MREGVTHLNRMKAMDPMPTNAATPANQVWQETIPAAVFRRSWFLDPPRHTVWTMLDVQCIAPSLPTKKFVEVNFAVFLLPHNVGTSLFVTGQIHILHLNTRQTYHPCAFDSFLLGRRLGVFCHRRLHLFVKPRSRRVQPDLCGVCRALRISQHPGCSAPFLWRMW